MSDGTEMLYGPSQYGTALSPDEEQKYQHWRATLPPRLQGEQDYDLRGFYRENPNFSVDQPGQHMTDKFKLPNHTTFSNESMYYNDQTKAQGGHWEGVPRSRGHWTYLPNDPAVKQRVEENAHGDPVDIDHPEDPEAAKAALLMSRLYGTGGR